MFGLSTPSTYLCALPLPLLTSPLPLLSPSPLGRPDTQVNFLIYPFPTPCARCRSINHPRFPFSNCALDELYKKKVKDCEQPRLLQRRTTNVLWSRSKAKYVVKKVATFFLAFYPHFKQSILKSFLLNIEKCSLNREHGCFFPGGGDNVDLGRK